MKTLLSSDNQSCSGPVDDVPLQDQYRNILDAVTVGLWVSDYKGRLQFFNKSWLRFTGRTLGAELSHKWDGEEIHIDDRASCMNTYKKCFKIEAPFEQEYRLKRYDGEFRWFHEFVKPYFGDSDTYIGFVGTCIDITERKQAILLANDELREKNKDLEQFAYVASHDLQEPLRKIQSFGELLKTRFENDVPEQAIDYINRMQKSATRMRNLVNDLLTFSRVTSRAKPFIKIKLNKEIKEIISDLEIILKETRGEIIVDDLPDIDADPSQLTQLLTNIINNGLKYHRKDVPPTIKITCQILEGTAVSPPQIGTREMVQLTISDNGIGFDEKYVDRIFEPFQRLHGRNEFEGTGIGLAICKKIIERHNGNITARSIEGEGTNFIIQLPLKQHK